MYDKASNRWAFPWLFNIGIMHHGNMLQYVPRHLSAIQWQAGVLSWVQGWTDQPNLAPLSPEGWYREDRGYQGVQTTNHSGWTAQENSATWYLWAPPPAAADACLEALNDSHLKQTKNNHVVFVPCLMTNKWRKGFIRWQTWCLKFPLGRPLFGLC
jgi:hypothetical protein